MSVSSALCEMYLPLLFTVLEKEPSEQVRTTALIALGDLAFRSITIYNIYVLKYIIELSTM